MLGTRARLSLSRSLARVRPRLVTILVEVIARVSGPAQRRTVQCFENVMGPATEAHLPAERIDVSGRTLRCVQACEAQAGETGADGNAGSQLRKLGKQGRGDLKLGWRLPSWPRVSCRPVARILCNLGFDAPASQVGHGSHSDDLQQKVSAVRRVGGGASKRVCLRPASLLAQGGRSCRLHPPWMAGPRNRAIGVRCRPDPTCSDE